MRITVLEIDRFPRPSVNWPSSKTWSRMLKTFGVRLLDFVEQDNRIRRTLDALGQLAALLVAHVAGGEPMSLETECFSMYSDISKRMSALGRSRIKMGARVAGHLVLPTPVGPEEQEAADGPVRDLSPAA